MLFPVPIFHCSTELLLSLAALGAASLVIYWLDHALDRYLAGQAEFSEQFQKLLEAGRPYLLALMFLMFCSAAQADSITTVPLVRVTDKLTVSDIDSYLDSNTVLPLMGDTSYLLAVNLWEAQFIANLHQADSLFLSETAVLRAIWLEWTWGETFCGPSNCEIMWDQSRIAINDLAHATLTPPVLDFGNVNQIPVQLPN